MEQIEYEGRYPSKYNIRTSDFYQPNYSDSYECDNWDPERGYTIIFKVKYKDNIFILNRNSNLLGAVFNDKYVKWWESDLCWFMGRLRNIYTSYKLMNGCDELEILETLPYDNMHLRHQKKINPIKAKYIKIYNATEPDDTLSNILFNNIKDVLKENYRRKYHKQYTDFRSVINECQPYLYENAKKLYYTSDKYFLTLTRDKIWNITNRNIKTKACYIILRDYINFKIGKGCNIPFDTRERKINDTLNMLITVNDLYEKKKLRNLITKELYV